MEPVRPTRPVSPVISAWVERRRRHLAAQLAAADEERWEDLAEMVAEAGEEEMPRVDDLSPEDRRRAETLLEEADLLNRKLAAARARLLEALDEPDPDTRSGPGAPRRTDGRGGRLDGYV